MSYPKIAEFCYNSNTEAIDCQPFLGSDPQLVRDILLNQVQPLTKSKQGHLVLHASAVTVQDRAVLFLGKSGAGKSTLATWFALKNHRLVCEDGAVFSKDGRELTIEPGHHSIRLWRDSREELLGEVNDNKNFDQRPNKLRISEPKLIAFSEEPQRVQAVFHINETETNVLKLDRLTPRDALASCLRNMFLLDDRDPDVLLSHFDQLTDLSNSMPHFTLNYPRRYGDLSRVRDAILEQCSMAEMKR